VGVPSPYNDGEAQSPYSVGSQVKAVVPLICVWTICAVQVRNLRLQLTDQYGELMQVLVVKETQEMSDVVGCACYHGNPFTTWTEFNYA